MDDIEIVDYDPRWPLLFDEEARSLRAVLDPSQVVGLEHFGSTAIPGLSAKPIIDILIAVRSLAAAQATYLVGEWFADLASSHRGVENAPSGLQTNGGRGCRANSASRTRRRQNTTGLSRM